MDLRVFFSLRTPKKGQVSFHKDNSEYEADPIISTWRTHTEPSSALGRSVYAISCHPENNLTKWLIIGPQVRQAEQFVTAENKGSSLEKVRFFSGRQKSSSFTHT